MVAEVNRLVGDLLAAGQPLALPGIGTLRPEARPARRISKKQVVPPSRAIDFSSEVQGTTLPQRLAAAARCSEEQAEEIYRRWVGHTLQEGVLTLAGIGVLKEKHFTLDADFDRRINPQGHAPLTIRRRRRRFDWALALGIVAIIAAVGIGGYGYRSWREAGGSLPWLDKRAPAAAVQPAETASAAEPGTEAAETAEVAEAAAGTTGSAASAASTASAAGTQPATASFKAPAEQAEQAGQAGQAGAAKTAASSTAKANAAAKPEANGAANGSRTASPNGTAAAQDTAKPAARPARDGVTTMTPGRYYVVLGVFSTVENAERAVAETARKEESMRCGIYRFGAKWMVSPFESADAEACTLFRRAHREQFPDLWIYRAR